MPAPVVSAGAEERKAAGLILALIVVGTMVRFAVGGEAPVGEVAYQAAGGPRPPRDSVLEQAAHIGRPLGPGERVDVDRASAPELVRLPGIGSGLSARIVRSREVEGPFGSLEALGRVPGIGPTALRRLEPHVTFSGRARPIDTQESEARIRVNSADEEMLATLPGIGPAKARAIVEDRKARGPFRDLADLGRVRGIGPATLEALAPLVIVP